MTWGIPIKGRRIKYKKQSQTFKPHGFISMQINEDYRAEKGKYSMVQG
jgi:hypothetical protein